MIHCIGIAILSGLTVAAGPVIRDLTIKNQWRQWRGRELRVTINSNLMIVMMSVQTQAPLTKGHSDVTAGAQTQAAGDHSPGLILFLFVFDL